MEVDSIAESLLFVTVRIDTINSKGEKGSGTGFIFSHKYKEVDAYTIITNKHVIKDAVKGGITFIRKENEKPKLASAFRLEFNSFQDIWTGHKDNNIDITATPLIPLLKQIKDKHNVDIYFKSISSNNIPTDEQVADFDALEDIIFVGYPNGIWDNYNYLPIMRKGTTATPYSIDFENQKKFLIDASVFGGSSGSPLFLYNSGSYKTKKGSLMAGSRLFFLGVVSAVFFRKAVNEIISIPIPTKSKDISVGQEMIDLGIVIKAITVIETVENLIDIELSKNKN